MMRRGGRGNAKDKKKGAVTHTTISTWAILPSKILTTLITGARIGSVSCADE